MGQVFGVRVEPMKLEDRRFRAIPAGDRCHGGRVPRPYDGLDGLSRVILSSTVGVSEVRNRAADISLYVLLAPADLVPYLLRTDTRQNGVGPRVRSDVKPLCGKGAKLPPGHWSGSTRWGGRDLDSAGLSDGSEKVVPLGDGDRLCVLYPPFPHSLTILVASQVNDMRRAAMFEGHRLSGRMVEDEAKLIGPRPQATLDEVADDKNGRGDAARTEHRGRQREDLFIAVVDGHGDRIWPHRPSTKLLSQVMQRHHATTPGHVLHVFHEPVDWQSPWTALSVAGEAVKGENNRVVTTRAPHEPKQPGAKPYLERDLLGREHLTRRRRPRDSGRTSSTPQPDDCPGAGLRILILLLPLDIVLVDIGALLLEPLSPREVGSSTCGTSCDFLPGTAGGGVPPQNLRGPVGSRQ